MWPDSDQTRELLANAGEGRPEAVDALLDRHREALRQMVQFRMDRAVARRVDASDVVQDVLLEASQRLGDYLRNPAMPFHLWLRQMAKDRMIDLHRRHRGAQRRSVDRERPLAAAAIDRSSLDMASRFIDAELTPAAASIRKELEQRFFDALQKLEDDDREVIVMRHFEQLGNSEVAQALHLSQAAAGMRYLRALRRLKTLLGEEGTPA